MSARRNLCGGPPLRCGAGRLRVGSASGDGMHITGSGIRINTGDIGGDQQQIHVSGGDTPSAQLQAAQAELAEWTIGSDDYAGALNNADAARRAAARIDENHEHLGDRPGIGCLTMTSHAPRCYGTAPGWQWPR
ncbi:MAG: hypothetical protein HOY79_10515 [Streptomyces sp.]|nr:hypothetical protein [Streptomyces sp.]